MNTVYISAGGNIGDRMAYLKAAIQELKQLPKSQVIATSSIYETPAWGKTDQQNFLNLVCKLKTEFSAPDFLLACQAIEKKLGRIRKEKWGERTLDLDIIFWNDECIQTDTLTVPHPYAHERAFVLVPLAELEADFLHPTLGKSISQLLLPLADDVQTIHKYGDSPN